MQIKEIETCGSKPFLKWPGGKFRIVPSIKDCFPKKINRLIEPFVGAGSVFLNAGIEKCVISDSNVDLISVYKAIKTCFALYISECQKMFINENNCEEKYYFFRDEFNNIDSDPDSQFRKAVLFLYLNRHCFNGLVRYNKSGKFNVPYNYAEPYFPKQELINSAKIIKNAEIQCCDFRNAFKSLEPDDVVYCDPPFLPIGSVFYNIYSDNSFGLKDHLDLIYLAKYATEFGATVIISNHYNWYSDQLYSKMNGADIKIISVPRNISADTSNRNSVKEVLAIFSPEK